MRLWYKDKVARRKSATIFQKSFGGPGAMAHACNPNHSGGRDQEDHGSKPTQANSLQDPISKKKNHHKIGLVEWLKV
jgi:hypothetical protein